MSSMDKKQRKEKKRLEKKKAIKMKASAAEDPKLISERKSFGKIQLAIFGVIAVSGALLIILNV